MLIEGFVMSPIQEVAHCSPYQLYLYYTDFSFKDNISVSIELPGP